MKIGLLSGLIIATLAASGSAQADTVTISLIGQITGGTDGGLGGANDTAAVFGGGNLEGAQVNIAFTYDASTMLSNGGGYTLLPLQYDVYFDHTGSNGISQQVSIASGSYTYTGLPSASASTEFAQDCLFSGCGHPELIVGQSSSTNTSDKAAEIQLYGPSDLPLGSLNDLTALNTYVANATTGLIYVEFDQSSLVDNLDFSVSSASVSETPEPTTWLLAAIGLTAAHLLIAAKAIAPTQAALTASTRQATR